MPRRYDEDGQPMMSNAAMLKMLVDEIPVNDKRFSDLQDQVNFLASDLKQVKLDLNEVKSDLKGLRIQTHQNYVSFITNQQDMEKRIAVLEAR